MERISVRVWTEVCKCIGTEDEVFVRRQVVECNETIFKHIHRKNIQCFMPIISGSRVEGLIQPDSDIDLMYVFNFTFVSDNSDFLNGYIIMDTDNIKPGFVRLVCSDKLEYYGEFIEAMIEKNDGLILSSLLFRDQMVDHMRETFTDTIAHGPCALYDIGFNIEVDTLICLSCNTWPRVATEWIARVRINNWPSPDLISDIVRDGCLLVPIGNPNSQESYLEWRLSFSLAEKNLYILSIIHNSCVTKSKIYFVPIFSKQPYSFALRKKTSSGTKRLMKWVSDEYCPNFLK
ncbi:LOW QUALITY PROTEIN: hypothetical protein KUTeg_018294 [Tegillarca granosa]|uniref:Mab-21-like nucleotidyltransferase domain-containing protein n=1 Tax=Tegillarca granosa TaxID=220873 RepID=A0ABQ9EJZ9_TEGGR|nr:LOW QUALITY PROTEIN: hypothetical protein KUTeg_018294 [Tegillarca granosa]